MKQFTTTGLALIAALLIAAPAQGQVIDDIFRVSDDKAEDTFLDLGIAAISRPEYLGSDEQGLLVVPYFNAEYKGRFYLNPYRGLGMHVVNTDRFRLSGGVSYIFGRDGEDTPFNLTKSSDPGAFDLDGSLAARASGRVNFKYGIAEVTVTQPLGGDIDGAEVTGSVATMIPTGFDKLRLFPSLSMTWAQEDRINAYYGINTAQSIAVDSNQTITFGDGLSHYGASLAGFYAVTEKIEAIGVVNYSRLTDSLPDSPLVTQDDGVTATIGLAYKFK